ncbi:hypothetical protein EVJ50_07175 [Synechococcus sp. RSCCF101]|uniref:hypothetical protein n=1 Tax=Synechococcus sp. RSCCF101 TaxID=2511069 RepID=UPI0012476C18|nr:hypothetical protein [Synechococcus sp. RSCCF101]QEY32050.1 hypothetical protein EVJ50_07175 [Synechococcus sp. RSCCF101]
MSSQSEATALRAGAVVAALTGLSVAGPMLGLPASWLALISAGGLAALTLDAASFSGMGGHILAEALPGGQQRLWRIAAHEAGHVLMAQAETIPVSQVLVGSLACVRAGLTSRGATAFSVPDHAKLPLEELRRWSRVLQAGMVAEELLLGEAWGGRDDRHLLGRLWGLSGHDVDTARREQRLARREVTRRLRSDPDALKQQARQLLDQAPRLFRGGAS